MIVITLLIIFVFVLPILFKNKKIKKITSEKAKKMISNKKFYKIIDVRTKKEWDEGHHPYAMNIPLNEFKNFNFNKLNKKPIFIYCRSGRRALVAAKKLVKKGFNNIYYIGKTYKSLL